MPNLTTLCPILLFLPVIILVLVAALVGITHVTIAWLANTRAAGTALPERATCSVSQSRIQTGGSAGRIAMQGGKYATNKQFRLVNGLL